REAGPFPPLVAPAFRRLHRRRSSGGAAAGRGRCRRSGHRAGLPGGHAGLRGGPPAQHHRGPGLPPPGLCASAARRAGAVVAWAGGAPALAGGAPEQRPRPAPVRALRLCRGGGAQGLLPCVEPSARGRHRDVPAAGRSAAMNWTTRLDARQRAMLAEMGVQVWAPEAKAVPATTPVTAAVVEPPAAPIRSEAAEVPAPRVAPPPAAPAREPQAPAPATPVAGAGAAAGEPAPEAPA